MTEEIIKEVQRVFPEAPEGMIRKTILETRKVLANKQLLDELKEKDERIKQLEVLIDKANGSIVDANTMQSGEMKPGIH